MGKILNCLDEAGINGKTIKGSAFNIDGSGILLAFTDGAIAFAFAEAEFDESDISFRDCAYTEDFRLAELVELGVITKADADAEESAKASAKEKRERAELDRLKAKFEGPQGVPTP